MAISATIDLLLSTEMAESKRQFNRNYDVELWYKGASKADHGSFELYAAYRHLGNMSVIAPTFGATEPSWKGWEVGGEYALRFYLAK